MLRGGRQTPDARSGRLRGWRAGRRASEHALIEHALEVRAIARLAEWACQSAELLAVDETLTESDLLGTADFEALPRLDGLDEVGCCQERGVSARVGPGDAAPQDLDMELFALEVGAIDVGDLELTARGGLQLAGNPHAPVVVEVESRDGVVRAGHRRLLLEADGAPSVVELDDTIALGIAHVVSKHGGALLAGGSMTQLLGQSMPVKEVIAEYQADRVARHEILGDQEGLGDAARCRLRRVAHADAPLRAIPEKPREERTVLRRRNQHNVAYSGKHQRRQRVVDERLVVQRQQLLGDRACHRIKPRPRAAGEYDPFSDHFIMPVQSYYV